MKKINVTIATIALVAVITIFLSSCHRNTCPTFGEGDVDTEQRA